MPCIRWGAEGFLSTPSARRATWAAERKAQQEQNFYPRPPRGGRLVFPEGDLRIHTHISIHALREEGDTDPEKPATKPLVFLSTPSAKRATMKIGSSVQHICISIHALREEGDNELLTALRHLYQFLSTPSARRATGSRPTRSWPISNFYPRPPRGGRLVVLRGVDEFGLVISIHALREEGDLATFCCFGKTFLFLSTPSARRATSKEVGAMTREQNFYPRPPRGGRHPRQTC